MDIWLHGRSGNTMRAYRADVECFRRMAGKPLAQVTLSDLQEFAGALEKLAPASRCRTLSAIKSLLAFGHRIGCLPFDVGRVLHLPAVRNRLSEKILSEADLHRLLSLEPNLRNRAMLTLLYASAIRVSELCGLCWRDLQPNGGSGQITIFGKGGVTRSVQLPVSAWMLLLGLRPAAASPDDPVFRSRKKKAGGRLQPLAVLRLVRAAANGRESNCRSHRTGSGMHMPRMRSTGAPRSIWYRPPSGTPVSIQPDAISTPDPRTAPAGFSFVRCRVQLRLPFRGLLHFTAPPVSRFDRPELIHQKSSAGKTLVAGAPRIDNNCITPR